MTKPFDQLMTEHRRLAILRALANPDSAGRINDSILHTIVTGVGIASSRDQVRTAIGWLKEQGLVTVTPLDTGTLVAAITQAGCDVACGNATVIGVQRPAPGEAHG